MFKLTGKVVFVGEEQVINEKFKKRDFVVEDASAQYPQTIQFQAVQDKCDILNTVKINDVVAVSFNLKGRPWVSQTGETKYFNTLEAWKIENAGNVETSANIPQAAVTADSDGDLPF